jgi:hypothetical protein
MAAFFFEWKDFKGGYYVGPSETTQPTNTWTGYDITVADDDAALIPTYGEIDVELSGTNTSSGVIVAPNANTTWSNATYLNDYVVLVGRSSGAARVYFARISTGVVTTVALPTAGTTPGSAPILIPAGSDVIAYVVIGDGNIYKVTRSSGAVLTITPFGSLGINFTGLALWNARMLAWGSGSDTFMFSNALDFDTAWPSLNFISVGYANDGISYLVPRNLDVMIVKPSGWYSLTGVLGANASIRQLNDTLGIVSTDPVAQHNNVVYFMSSTGFENYSVNLMAISGQNVDVAAYNRFGLSSTRTDLAKTNMGYLAVTVSYIGGLGSTPDDSQAGATIYLFNAIGRWQAINVFQTSTVTQNLRYSMARGQLSRYGNPRDKNLYLIETSSGSTDNTVKIIKIRPNSIEPGKKTDMFTSTVTDDPNTATVKLSDVDSKVATIIRRVYVEAELIQFPLSNPDFYPYTGNATIQVKVNNKAVEDIPYSMSIGDATSGYSPAYSFPYSSFTTSPSRISSQRRILRFNVDNASFGYNNQVEIQFAGFRIKRVWVEGDTR